MTYTPPGPPESWQQQLLAISPPPHPISLLRPHARTHARAPAAAPEGEKPAAAFALAAAPARAASPSPSPLLQARSSLPGRTVLGNCTTPWGRVRTPWNPEPPIARRAAPWPSPGESRATALAPPASRLQAQGPQASRRPPSLARSPASAPQGPPSATRAAGSPCRCSARAAALRPRRAALARTSAWWARRACAGRCVRGSWRWRGLSVQGWGWGARVRIPAHRCLRTRDSAAGAPACGVPSASGLPPRPARLVSSARWPLLLCLPVRDG